MLQNPEPAQLNRLFELVSNYFSLLAEPERLRIMYVLCNGERTVSDIVKETNTSQANVSRHLNMLYRANILSRRKEGPQVYYRIEDTGTMNLCQTVCGQMSLRVEQEAALGRDQAARTAATSG